MVGTLIYTKSDQMAQQGNIVESTAGSIAVVVYYILTVIAIVIIMLLYWQSLRRAKLEKK